MFASERRDGGEGVKRGRERGKRTVGRGMDGDEEGEKERTEGNGGGEQEDEVLE